MSPARILDVGPLARLVEVAPGTAAAWAAALRADDIAGVVDVVPAARTVLVRCVDRASAAQVTSRLAHLDAPTLRQVDRDEPDRVAVVEILVVYDGGDVLDDVARATGLEPGEVIARHTSSSFRVDFCDFAPGFAYLSGLDEALCLPRRATPRTRVPAGSVAIASEYSAIYAGVHRAGGISSANRQFGCRGHRSRTAGVARHRDRG